METRAHAEMPLEIGADGMCTSVFTAGSMSCL